MFNKINKIIISKILIKKTFKFLQKHGYNENESHAIWAGIDHIDEFKITDVFFPIQTNLPFSYEVNEDEEHKINVKLNKLSIVAIAQIHTHPVNAFHSSTDNEWPSVILPGSISVVIPNYGFIEIFDIDTWEIYMYDGLNWQHVSKMEAKKLFRII